MISAECRRSSTRSGTSPQNRGENAPQITRYARFHCEMMRDRAAEFSEWTEFCNDFNGLAFFGIELEARNSSMESMACRCK